MSRQQAAAAAEKSAPDPFRDVWEAEAAEGAARELIEELIEAAHVSATAAAAKHKPATEPQPGLKSEKAPVVTDAEAARLRREAEAREDRLRLERLKAELKGREYTYDQMGNVILIDAINPDKLPAYQHAPRVGVGADADAAPAPTAGRGRGRGQRQKRVPGRGDSGLKLRPELVNKPTFKPLESLQPSLIDTMQLCPGVTLREGAAERCGGARAFDAAHMSRTEFELFGRTSPGPGAPRMYADAAVAPENPIGEWPISPHKLTELKPLPTPHDSITQTGRGPGPNSPQRGQASLSPTYGLRVRNSSGVKEKLPPTGLAS